MSDRRAKVTAIDNWTPLTNKLCRRSRRKMKRQASKAVRRLKTDD
jgi:hypothetical protein